MQEDDLYCDTCDYTVARESATRRETYGDLDAENWQVLCCPDCGTKLKTVFVAPLELRRAAHADR